MKLFVAFMLTAACALSGAKYQSDLLNHTQAAFFTEAERAYRDIIAYDENAPVTKKELHWLYALDALLAPVYGKISAITEKLDSLQTKTPREYAQRCIYEGRVLEKTPEDVIFVYAYLYPFTPAEAAEYDKIQKSGDSHALDALFSPLEDWVFSCRGAYTAENGFEPYLWMQDENCLIPCARGVQYLNKEAAFCAMSLSEETPFSPPVRDARGVVVFEFFSD